MFLLLCYIKTIYTCILTKSCATTHFRAAAAATGGTAPSTAVATSDGDALSGNSLWFETIEEWWHYLEGLVEVLGSYGEECAPQCNDRDIWKRVAFKLTKEPLLGVREAAMASVREALSAFAVLEPMKVEEEGSSSPKKNSPKKQDSATRKRMRKTTEEIGSGGASLDGGNNNRQGGAGSPAKKKSAKADVKRKRKPRKPSAAVPARMTLARRYHAVLFERISSPCSMSRWTSANLSLWTHEIALAKSTNADDSASGVIDEKQFNIESSSFSARMNVRARSTFATVSCAWEMSVNDAARPARVAEIDDKSTADALALCASVVDRGPFATTAEQRMKDVYESSVRKGSQSSQSMAVDESSSSTVLATEGTEPLNHSVHNVRQSQLQPRTDYSSARLRGGSGRYSASVVYDVLNKAYMNGAADPLIMMECEDYAPFEGIVASASSAAEPSTNSSSASSASAVEHSPTDASSGMTTLSLAQTKSFNSIGAKQPFRVIVRPEAAFVADAHAHMCKNEIIGFLAGKWHAKERVVEIAAAYPCRSLSDTANQDVNVEMDPVSELQIRHIINARGLDIVGWYHSHPTFQSDPSVRDIENQTAYQLLFRSQQDKMERAERKRRSNNKNSSGSSSSYPEVVQDAVDEPFVGIIVGPYDPRLPSLRSWFCLFHVVRASEAAAIACASPAKAGNPEESPSPRSLQNVGENSSSSSSSTKSNSKQKELLLVSHSNEEDGDDRSGATSASSSGDAAAALGSAGALESSPSGALGNGGDEAGSGSGSSSGSMAVTPTAWQQNQHRMRNKREIKLTARMRASAQDLARRSLGHPMRIRGECGAYNLCVCHPALSGVSSLSRKLLERAAARRRKKQRGKLVGAAEAAEAEAEAQELAEAQAAAATGGVHVFDASGESVRSSKRSSSVDVRSTKCAPNAKLSVRMEFACQHLVAAQTEKELLGSLDCIARALVLRAGNGPQPVLQSALGEKDELCSIELGEILALLAHTRSRVLDDATWTDAVSDQARVVVTAFAEAANCPDVGLTKLELEQANAKSAPPSAAGGMTEAAQVQAAAAAAAEVLRVQKQTHVEEKLGWSLPFPIGRYTRVRFESALLITRYGEAVRDVLAQIVDLTNYYCRFKQVRCVRAVFRSSS